VGPQEPEEPPHGLRLAASVRVVVDAGLGPVDGQAEQALLERHGLGQLRHRPFVESPLHPEAAGREAMAAAGQREVAAEALDGIDVANDLVGRRLGRYRCVLDAHRARPVTAVGGFGTPTMW
jgi:sugar phosphate isomerase/epimerase